MRDDPEADAIFEIQTRFRLLGIRMFNIIDGKPVVLGGRSIIEWDKDGKMVGIRPAERAPDKHQ